MSLRWCVWPSEWPVAGQSLEQVAHRSSANASNLFALPYQPQAEPASFSQEG